ncbi:GNAT family N-acetyltransferase [Paenibacillus sp. Marseille-P2973]|uniref:GNAT family N-acetyltransferase n=1 Tax=Paenibacillus sp. Marseille-P2973 TaxID=1871032 RepID=UPI001B36C840|nr:GNAT family N-acetyltransferase [Paenibacillus sp. Marseille-P2973]
MDSIELKMRKLNSYSEILGILQTFDDSFNPKISEKVGSLEEYAKKINTFALTYTINRNDEVAGFISFYVNEKEVYIALIATKRTERRSKLGTQLLNKAIEYCEKNCLGYVRLELDDQNNIAQRFYEKHGFTEDLKSSETTTYYIYNIVRSVS